MATSRRLPSQRFPLSRLAAARSYTELIPMKLKSVLLAAFGLLAAQSCALAASTIDPSQPPLRGSFTSAPVRDNFLAAYTDINNILGVFARNTAPMSPTNLQSWADTTASPVIVFKYWNQANGV